MVSEIQETVKSNLGQVWITEFGLVEGPYFEPEKKYQGRMYRLSPDAVKTLSELVGFTVKFDSPSVRTAYLDILKSDAYITFEIDRNTSPMELGLRYGRDRWNAVDSESRTGRTANLSPWLKSNYQAKFLADKVLAGVAEQLKMKPEEREHFLIRINFRDRTIGLVGEDQFVEEFPAGAFEVFALPRDHVPTIPGVLVGEDSSAQRGAASSAKETGAAGVSYPTQAPADRGAKYATYSQSEIDRMLKQQTDNITNVLSGKISAQQRLFQDAVTSQEKAFARLADRLGAEVEGSRAKLEAQTKSAQDTTKAELEQFRTQLSKELDQFRAHVNKNIAPLAKTFEDKVQALQVAASEGRENVRPLLLAIGGGLAAAILISAVLIMTVVPKQSDINELKTELSKLSSTK